MDKVKLNHHFREVGIEELPQLSSGGVDDALTALIEVEIFGEDFGPSYEPISKNVDEFAVPQNSNESRICSHQVLVSSPLVEELAVENIARRILLDCLTDWLHSQGT